MSLEIDGIYAPLGTGARLVEANCRVYLERAGKLYTSQAWASGGAPVGEVDEDGEVILYDQGEPARPYWAETPDQARAYLRWWMIELANEATMP